MITLTDEETELMGLIANLDYEVTPIGTPFASTAKNQFNGQPTALAVTAPRRRAQVGR